MITTGRQLVALMRSCRDDPKRRAARRRAAMRALAEALADSPFQRRRLASCGLQPADLQEPRDLEALPIMERSDLQRHLNEVSTPAAAARGVRSLRTSGSSGAPLETRITPGEESLRRALHLRARLLAGRKVWWREAVIGSFPESAEGRDGTRRWSLYLSATRPGAELLAELQAFDPRHIIAFPSTLLRLGNKPGLRPGLITTGAEVLEPDARATLERRFGAPVRDTYGAIETGLLAFQCRHGVGYHLNDDLVHFELRRLERGADQRELLVTPLYARAVPLVRYRLGDLVRPLEGRCACGCTLTRISVVEGRRDDWLLHSDGCQISPAAIRALFRGQFGPLEYRVTQHPDYHLELELALLSDQAATADRLARALASIAAQSVELRLVPTIAPEPAGKLRAVRRLPIAEPAESRFCE